MKRTTIITAVAAVLGLGALLLPPPSTTAQSAVGPKSEHMLLLLDADPPLGLTARSQIEVRPPAASLSGKVVDTGVAQTEFSFRTVQRRHAGLAALDLLSEQGWDVVSMSQQEDGKTAVLLKRRVR